MWKVSSTVCCSLNAKNALATLQLFTLPLLGRRIGRDSQRSIRCICETLRRNTHQPLGDRSTL